MVELLVVIVVISTLCAMTVPRLYGTARRTKLRSCASRLLVAAQYARDFAATRRGDCYLVIDPDQRRYALMYQKYPQHKPSELAQMPTGVGKAQRLDEGLWFAKVLIESRAGPEHATRQDNRITFDPTGRATAAVVAITDGRRTISMLVAPGTGKAMLVERDVNMLPNDRRDLDE